MQKTRPTRAFTLVELLVVIGIIAVLVSILLPTLGRVRGQANMTTCSAQLRSVMQLALVYAAENKGSMPWGFAWRNSNPDGTFNTAIPSGILNSTYVWPDRYMWYTTLNSMSNKDGNTGLWPVRLQTPTALINQIPRLNKAFLCPDVANNEGLMAYTSVTYGFNMVVMPNQSFEINPANSQAYMGYTGGTSTVSPYGSNTSTVLANQGTSRSIPPAKLGQLYPDTAVLWDQQLWVTGGTTTYRPHNVQGGLLYSGVDSGLQYWPQRYKRRYRGLNKTILPELDDNNPIRFPTFAYEREVSPGTPWSKDLTTTTYVTPSTPNVRFRHQNDRVANVAFADGSVRGLKVDQKRLAYETSTGAEVAQSEFLRMYLKIKAPGGLPSPQSETE